MSFFVWIVVGARRTAGECGLSRRALGAPPRLGDAAMFYLDSDSRYIMPAPAWHAFRGGLVLLTAATAKSTDPTISTLWAS